MPTNTATLERTITSAERLGLEQATADFFAVRPRLLGIAYRIVGSWAAAEDIVQDAWVRWQTCQRHEVRNPTAFLVTVTTRLAINTATSARARYESSVGDWTAEPIDFGDDPATKPERNEELELGALLLLERLSTTERAAYVLRHAFDYPYSTIAAMLQLSEANVRQIVRRAGGHLASDRCFPVDTADHRSLVSAFVAAAERGELAELEQVLAA